MKNKNSKFSSFNKIRVAINYGNVVLAQKSENGTPKGISVRLAKYLSQKLSLPLEFVCFESAGDVVAAADNAAWDIAFIARDPKRAKSLRFTHPYLVIEGSYLVRKNSAFYSLQSLDQEDVKIAVGKNAAYDLYLSRTLKKATLIRATTTPAALDLFIQKKLDVLAGVKQPLNDFASQNNDYRLIEPSFMKIEQAIAMRIEHSGLLTELNTLLTEAQANLELWKSFSRE